LKPKALTPRVVQVRKWLDNPLSQSWCVCSWLAASLVFFCLAAFYGGAAQGDSSESLYSTWSLAHGNLACFYPPLINSHSYGVANPFALTAPLYPLLSGIVAWLVRVGHSIPFPHSDQLGPNCQDAIVKMYHWSLAAGAIHPTLQLAWLVWPFLVTGLISVIRATRSGRTGWEPLLLFAVAVTPCVLMCITSYFHPEDLLSMGLLLIGVAAFLKKKWGLSGALLGLAVCAQQFALLVAIPLLVIAPSRARLKIAAAAIIVSALIDVPLIIASSGRGLRTVLLGSSRAGSAVRSTGGTVLWELDLKGPLLLIVSRVMPVVVVAVLAWWASRHLGERLLEPTSLMSLLATSLVVRLIFEENLFGYYFMAAAVSLIVLDVISGRLRGAMVAWLAVGALTFSPFYLGYQRSHAGSAILFVLVTLALLSLLTYVVVLRLPAHETGWFIYAAAVFEFRVWGLSHNVFAIPNWWWQVTLVPTAFALAVSPFVVAMGTKAALEDYKP
jgi:hypothetical protein